MAYAKIKRGLREAAHEVIAELDDKPKLYTIVDSLTIALKYELDRKTVSLETLNSVNQLHARLCNAMNEFNKPCTFIDYPNQFQKFKEECHSAIFDYQPSLMSAPDLLSQIKAYINNFFEQYFGVDPFFHTERSELGLKRDFSNKFFDVKNELKSSDDEESDFCFSF